MKRTNKFKGTLTLKKLKKFYKEMTEHQHYWELTLTKWESPYGLSGTSAATEYAYLLCQGCATVKKVEVK